MGIAALEAQISGLSCIASTAVPRDVDISGDVMFLELAADEWIAGINEFASRQGNGRAARRRLYDLNASAVRTYDIRENAKELERLYRSIAER